MQNIGCEKCEQWSAARPIRTPGELEARIVLASEAVRGGLLTVHATKEWVGGCSFEEWSEEWSTSGTWPDYLEHTFACSACGQEFELCVETYHGLGGAWTPKARDPG